MLTDVAATCQPLISGHHRLGGILANGDGEPGEETEGPGRLMGSLGEAQHLPAIRDTVTMVLEF